MSLSISDLMRPKTVDRADAALRDVLCAAQQAACGRCGQVHRPEIIGYGSLAGVVFVSCGSARLALRLGNKLIVRVCPPEREG